MLQLIYQLIICLGAEKEMKKVTLQHVLGNKILEYDVDDRGVIIDEREKDRYAKQQDSKEKLMSNWIKEHIVFHYDVKKQGATNETLKQSAYLQDLSGKGRRMKLNNFLFDMMSGVDGYQNEGFVNISGAIDIRFDHINGRQIKGKPAQDWGKFGYYRAKNMVERIIYCKWHVEGILDDNKVYAAQYTVYDNRVELHNGDNYIELDTNQGNPGYNYISVISDQPYSTDITITQIPEYPGALVTDGVDDYGLVENSSSGVKMLFMTVNPIGNFNSFKNYYSQMRNAANQPFCVYSTPAGIAYNYSNLNGITYIDGVLNESIGCTKLWGLKHTITIVNDTVNPTNSGQPAFFSREEWRKSYYSKIAFYNSIAFDSIPTEADGFTEQELIDYVIDKYELK